MEVQDIISMCEYIGCDVYDALGNEIIITDKNCSEIYKMSVEHIDAKDSVVRIFTFKNIDKL